MGKVKAKAAKADAAGGSGPAQAFDVKVLSAAGEVMVAYRKLIGGTDLAKGTIEYVLIEPQVHKLLSLLQSCTFRVSGQAVERGAKLTAMINPASSDPIPIEVQAAPEGSASIHTALASQAVAAPVVVTIEDSHGATLTSSATMLERKWLDKSLLKAVSPHRIPPRR